VSHTDRNTDAHTHTGRHTQAQTHTRSRTRAHTPTIAQKGEWEAEDAYILKDEQNPDIDFSGARGKGDSRADGKAKTGGGGIFDSLQFLRLDKFEMTADDCKVRWNESEA